MLVFDGLVCGMVVFILMFKYIFELVKMLVSDVY